MSDETKKKISEALTKGFGTKDEASGRTAAGQAYLDRFVGKRVEYEETKAERDDLRAEIKKLGKKKAGKAARDKIRTQIKALDSKLKQQRETLVAIKKEATGKKAQASAKVGLQKAEGRINQHNALLTKITDLLVRTSDTNRKARLQAQLERVVASKGKTEKQVEQYRKAASGEEMRKRASMFDFNDSCSHVQLSEQAFKPRRRLSMQERRVNFEALNDKFDQMQVDLEVAMAAITTPEVERVTESTKKKLDAGDILAVAAIAFMFRTEIRALLNGAVKKSYDFGRDMAASEIKAEKRPGTPLSATQIMNTDSDLIADAFADTLENTAKGAILDGLAAGAGVSAILSAMRDRVNEEASRDIINVSGTVIGQYVNRGRASVLFDNIHKITAFQRSEVLDSRTCPMCLALDERVVKPDDPAVHMDIVHTHCRGLWVPVFASDDEKPDVTGIPKSVMESFDTVDGRPVVNAFKQLKRPMNEVSKKAQEEIKKRLETKK